MSVRERVQYYLNKTRSNASGTSVQCQSRLVQNKTAFGCGQNSSFSSIKQQKATGQNKNAIGQNNTAIGCDQNGLLPSIRQQTCTGQNKNEYGITNVTGNDRDTTDANQNQDGARDGNNNATPQKKDGGRVANRNLTHDRTSLSLKPEQTTSVIINALKSLKRTQYSSQSDSQLASPAHNSQRSKNCTTFAAPSISLGGTS